MVEIKVDNTGNGFLTCVTSVDPSSASAQTVNVLATYQPTVILAEGALIAPEVADTGLTQPPLPPAFQPVPYTEPEFDYRQLQRLTLFPSKSITTLISGIRLEIKGVDYSDNVYSFDWATPLSGPSIGTIILRETAGVSLDPEDTGITIEDDIQIWVKFRDLEEQITKAQIVGSPSYTLNSLSTYELELSIGCQLELLENSNRSSDLYCGPDPVTAGDAAVIYARTNKLRTLQYPQGHTLQEPFVNFFTEDSAYTFLQDLYAPSGRDVRCNRNNSIVVPLRKSFDEANAVEINFTEVIESNTQFTRNLDVFGKVKISNDYVKLEPFNLERRATRRISGKPTDTRPWFQGGYTETEIITVTLGDTLIYQKETTNGYIPTNPQPWSAALVQEDPCLTSGFTTTFGKVNEKVKSLGYQEHSSGSYLVIKESEWETGLKLRPQNDDTEYVLFEGRLGYKFTNFNNLAQLNVEVCAKDYLHVIVSQVTNSYTLNDGFQLYRDSFESSSYSVRGSNPNSGQTSFTGIGQTWTQTLVTGQFDSNSNTFVVQPAIVNENTDPPGSRWIRQKQNNFLNFTEYSIAALPQTREPSDINGPFCYNVTELNTVADRFLREEYGLANSLQIVVPWSTEGNVGDSVKYTNRKGKVRNYLIFAIEYNLTVNSLSKTYTLALDV